MNNLLQCTYVYNITKTIFQCTSNYTSTCRSTAITKIRLGQKWINYVKQKTKGASKKHICCLPNGHNECTPEWKHSLSQRQMTISKLEIILLMNGTDFIKKKCEGMRNFSVWDSKQINYLLPLSFLYKWHDAACYEYKLKVV